MDSDTTFDDRLYCTIVCWAIGGLAGVLAAVMLVMLGGFGVTGAVFLGFLVFLLAGWLIAKTMCQPIEVVDQSKYYVKGGKTGSYAPPKTPAQEDFERKSAAAREALAAAAASAAGLVEEKATGVVSSLKTAKDQVAQKAEETRAAAAEKVESVRAPEPAPAKAEPAPEPEPEPAPAAPADSGGKPVFLPAAREGGPDDLKKIKGVGPKLEGTLHRMGVYHFDQIAAWGPAEIAWMDDNLEGFKGRVSRDDWVEQAKLLAKGGETEFSQRVEKGGVYDGD